MYRANLKPLQFTQLIAFSILIKNQYHQTEHTQTYTYKHIYVVAFHLTPSIYFDWISAFPQLKSFRSFTHIPNKKHRRHPVARTCICLGMLNHYAMRVYGSVMLSLCLLLEKKPHYRCLYMYSLNCMVNRERTQPSPFTINKYLIKFLVSCGRCGWYIEWMFRAVYVHANLSCENNITAK